MAVVAGVLLDQVAHDPAQGDPLPAVLRLGQGGQAVRAGQRIRDDLVGHRDRLVEPGEQLLGRGAGRGGEGPAGVVSVQLVEPGGLDDAAREELVEPSRLDHGRVLE